MLVGGCALGAQRGDVGVDPRCRGARAVTGQVGEVQPVEGVFGVAVGVVVGLGRTSMSLNRSSRSLGSAGADRSAASAGWGMSASMVAGGG